MPPGTYLSGSVTCFFSFNLTGPSNKSGNLCNNSAAGYTCSAPNSVSYSNMPAGVYTLSVSPYTNTATSTVPVTFSYTSMQITPYTEFFFEGFEENNSATAGTAHTGNMYCNSNYTVPFAPPNSKNYIIQYWNLVGGIWNFNEKPYVQNMVLTGPVDDIRVFPSDGLMTTFTYNPLVGMTSKTDPNGKSEIYQYDGLTRIQTIRDQDNNILKQYDYSYQSCLTTVHNVQKSGSFTKNNCGTGMTGSTVTYIVPAGKYSACDQTTADNLATTDVSVNGQQYANNNGMCQAAMANIYLSNTTSYSNSGSIYVLIDGVKYLFPNAHITGVFAVKVPLGTHSISFSCGPTFYYSITPGTTFYCASTQPAINWTVNSDITLTVYN